MYGSVLGLTEVSPPDPGHVPLTGGSGLVEITRSTRHLIHNSMGLETGHYGEYVCVWGGGGGGGERREGD